MCEIKKNRFYVIFYPFKCGHSYKKNKIPISANISNDVSFCERGYGASSTASLYKKIHYLLFST